MSHIHYIQPKPIDYYTINQSIKDFFWKDNRNFIGKCWLETCNIIKQFDPRICINIYDLNITSKSKPIQLGYINIYHRNDIIERIETN